MKPKVHTGKSQIHASKTQLSCTLILVALAVVLMPPQPAQAQAWSAEQQEVWLRIEECLALQFEQKDVDAMLGCIHEDFIGWDPDDPILRGKELAATIYRYFIEKADIPAYELRPLAIRVADNMAFAHYLLTTAERQPDGTDKIVRVRWTDIMLKENGQWYWIGDHGTFQTQ